mgnify:CR=1 FL=1
MTLDDFREALARTRLSLDSRAVAGALAVLVDGKSMVEATNIAGCTRQAIECARRRIVEASAKCPTCGRSLHARAG